MTVPTLTLLLDDGTGSFPYDISKYVMSSPGYSFNRGRQDWQGAVTAGTLSLTLNNSDGRFTVGSTLINATSPIRVDQQIRLKVTVGGTTFTRFTGRVKSWPVTWPATVTSFALAAITAVDAQARAERRPLRSVVEEEIMLDSPAAYYTLGEPAGATTAADSSGNQPPALAMAGTGTPVVFGTATGPGTDGLTAATFAAGMYLLAQFTSAPVMVEFTIATTGVSEYVIASQGFTDADNCLTIDSTGHLRAAITSSFGPAINDGQVHHITWAANQVTVDGSVYTPAISAPRATLYVGAPAATVAGYSGSMAHFATYGSLLSSSRIAAHASAVTTGFAGERTDQRITRLAGYAGLAMGTVDTGLTNVPFIDFSGNDAWPTIQDIVDAEQGLAFVNGSGSADFHNRSRSPAKNTPDLILAAGSYITPAVQPVDDDQQIVNYMDTTASATGIQQVVHNVVSESGDGTATHPGHGRYSNSKTYVVQTNQEALDRANWIITKFAEPTTRYGTLTVNLFAMTPALAATTLAALDLDCWLRVTGMGTQTSGGTTADVVVEGFTEQGTGESWVAVCNVVARSLFTALILDDPIFGALDSYPILF